MGTPAANLLDRRIDAERADTVFGHGFRYASNHQSAQGPMLADFDGDGVVGDDDDDLMDAELAAPSAGSVADLNGDGLVNAADATIFDSWLYSDQGSADERMMHVAGSSARMMLADGTTSFVALNEFGHQGLMHDEETGLVYNRARYLSPTLERFTAPDPIEHADGVGPYQYEIGNPVNERDALGAQVNFPTTPSQQQLRDLADATSAGGYNCMKWAIGVNTFDLAPAVRAGVLTQKQAVGMDDQAVMSNMGCFQRIMDAMIRAKGGYGATFGVAPRAGMRKVAAFRYQFGGAWDHHWITQGTDGKWTGKQGVTPVTAETTPEAQLASKELVGVWFIPAPKRTNPVTTARTLMVGYLIDHPGTLPHDPKRLDSETTTDVLFARVPERSLAGDKSSSAALIRRVIEYRNTP